MNNHTKRINYLLLITTLFLSLLSCGDMDETYRHFWNHGEKVYPAPADSLKLFSGKNRVAMSWIIKGDPNVKKAKIYWNNNTDSLVVPLQSTGKIDSLYLLINDLAEGTYSFDVFTFNGNGDKSVPRSVVGTVFGDSYGNSLLPRFMQSAFHDNNTLTITWGSSVGETSIGSEIYYKSSEGKPMRTIADSLAETTVIADFVPELNPTISYRTIYVPPMSIDTFYSAMQTVQAKGAPVYFPKTGWVATASSFDTRPGASYRPPQNTIDGNINTMWVNQISPQTYYPHTLTIDMGSVIEDVAGISMIVQKRNDTPRLIDVYVSNDGVGWSLMGLFTVENVSNIVQNFDFYEPQNIRYFRIIGKEPSGNTPNIVILEVGAYKY
ncbi:MAG: DUF4998 domain-containing protein [Proteiniphilum sp.]